MDPTGFAISVLSAAELALKCYSSLNDFYDKYKTAEDTQRKLRQELESLSKSIDQIKTLATESRDYNDQGSLIELRDNYAGPVSQCEEGLKKILDQLKSKLSVRERFAWSFQHEKKVQDMIASMQRLKADLNLALLIDLRKAQGAQLKQMEEEKLLEERRSLVQWIGCGVVYQTKHKTVCELRQEGTGQWIFANEEFKSWEATKSGLLWINGMAGNGKTVLTSSIISHFLQQPEASSRDFAYFYCDFRSKETIQSPNVIRTLIAQLLTLANTDGLNHLLGMKRSPGSLTDNTPPVSISELVDTLVEVLKTAHMPILVVDALDECDDVVKLLPHLVTVCDRVDVRMLVTSRDYINIREHLSNTPTISLAHIVESLKADIRDYVISSLKNTKMDNETRTMVIKALTEKANGMFRWVQCQVDTIKLCGSAGAVHKALDNLPKTLDETYERILKSIDRMGEDRQRIARQVLWMVFGALEPLELTALQEGLTVEPNIYEPIEDNRIFDSSIILDTCRSLLTVSRDRRGSEVVSFSHFSVKEYIGSNRCLSHYFVDPTQVDSTWVLHALTYFQFVTFTVECDTRTNTDRFGPLYKYCFEYWNQHADNCPPESFDQILVPLRRLFLDDNAGTTKQRLWYIHSYRQTHTYKPPDKDFQDIIGLCILLPLPTLLDYLLAKDPHLANATISSPLGTPLNLAAHVYYTNGAKAVTVLLDHGADINASHLVSSQVPRRSRWFITYPLGIGSWNPLLIAVHNGSRNLINLLLSRGANPNVISTPENYTPLHHCSKARYHGDDIARLLLEVGADVHATDSEGRTPLHCAVGVRYNADLVRVLLEHGANLEAEMHDGTTPVQLSRHEKITELLWEKGAKGIPRRERAIPKISQYDPRLRGL